jgi:DNA mismatch repair protein MutS
LEESTAVLTEANRSRGADTAPLSILFQDGEPSALATEAPAYFPDLNLDQVVASLTDGRAEYDLGPYFHTRLRSTDQVAYRHEVFRDLERDDALASITTFTQRMQEMRRLLALEHLWYEHQKKAWFLEAIEGPAALSRLPRRPCPVRGIHPPSR